MTRWSTATLGAVLGLVCAGCPVPAEAFARHRAPATAAHARDVHHGHRHRETHASRPRSCHAAGHHSGPVQEGKASVYAARLRGRRVADGTRFDPASDAAASKTLPLGTTARVTNLENGRTATVTVRDRGGVIRPPPVAGDTEINRGASPVGTMPVIPPPGAPGGNPQVMPK